MIILTGHANTYLVLSIFSNVKMFSLNSINQFCIQSFLQHCTAVVETLLGT